MNRRADLKLGKKPAPDDLAFVQAFVNTLDVESGQDDFKRPEGVSTWLGRHGSLAPGTTLTEDDRRRAVRFREALRSVLRSNHGEAPDARALAVLADVGAAAPLRLTPSEDGSLRLEPAANDLDANLAELLAIAHREMLTGRWQRLKVCSSDTCQWAFYDSSRNRSGAWCSMEVCGNREKVRGHRERTLQASP